MQKCCRDWAIGLRLLWLWKLCMLYISVATDQTMPSLRWTYCLSMFQITGVSPQYLYTCMFLASKLRIVIEGLWENLVILLPFLEYTVILDNALLLNNICILNFKKCYYLITHLVCHKYPRPDEEIYYCWIRQWYFQQTPGVILTVKCSLWWFMRYEGRNYCGKNNTIGLANNFLKE